MEENLLNTTISWTQKMNSLIFFTFRIEAMNMNRFLYKIL